ncbi:hypothetical protein CA600_19965 [Paenibacillus sp. VTT E-133280]|nr:hypothetical protein CA600_19965 [Paenibacillus sp. VTT E-133280]
MGCNNDGYILKGESESWKGDYRVSVTGNSRSGKYTFNYQKDDWKDVGKYTVTVGKNELILEEDGLLNRSIIITDDQISSIHDQESTKDVSIEWDGKKEKIELSR